MTNKEKGIICILAPWLCIGTILIVWTIVSSLFSSSLASGRANEIQLASRLRIINTALGFFGILSVIGIPAGALAGIMLLSKTEPPAGAK